MATRKDLLKAQSFTSRRMMAAFVDRDPDDPTPPLRRVGVASFVSVLLGVILLAGTALFGMLRPGGGNAWQEEGIIISDTSAGMLFVYSENSLVPMANVTSARLQAAGKDASGPPRVVKVSTESLRGTKQLEMRGIVGAPRQLPAPGDMQADPLRLCSSKPNTAGDRFVSLELAAPAAVDEAVSFVAKMSDGSQYLVAHGKYHRLWSRQNQPSPLAEGLPVVTPGNLWLSALPVGDPIEPFDIPGMNLTPSKNPLNMQVGQLAVVEGVDGSPSRYYIQLDAGLSLLSYLDMRLVQADRGMREPRKISENDLSGALNEDIPVSGNTDIDPSRPQGPAGYGSLKDASVCATFSSGDDRKVVLTVGQETPAMPPEHQKPYEDVVDFVKMDALSGALLQNANNPVDDAATFLVLGGKSYPIPDVASRRALGYGDVKPAAVPPQLISLLPLGLASDTNLSLAKITIT